MFPQYGGLSLANWRAKKTNSCFVTARLCEVIQYNAPLRALRVQGHCLLGEGVPARHLVVGLGVVERALSVAEPALAGVLEGGHLHALVGARSRLLVREGLGQELLGREELLRGKSNAVPVLGKLICSCSQVGEGNLKESIAAGCSSFNELCKTTGAGLGCGSCKPEVRDLLKNHKAEMPSV